MSSCCLTGKVQEGTPKGHVETIAGLQTYVAEPKDGSKSKTVIFLVDSKSSVPSELLSQILMQKSLWVGVQEHSPARRPVRCQWLHCLHSRRARG